MAVYQLGALVTKIKGSIGGTTFKTQRTTNVVMRKSYGYGRSKLLSNAALQYARYIFTRWSSLSPEEQSSWQNTAAIVFFPDKFGNQVHITGRQLFTKVNINLQKENYYQAVPEGFTMNVPVLDVETALMNATTKYASLGVEFFDEGTGYVIISAEVSVNNLQSAVFSRRYALTRSLTTGAALIEFGAEFFSRFPYVTSGYNIRMYVEAMNIYGIKGLSQAVPVQFLDIDYYFNISNYGINNAWDVLIPLDTNLPVTHIYDMYYQTSDTAMPEANFEEAVYCYSSGFEPNTVMGYTWQLQLLPASLRYGNYVRIWIKPRPIDDIEFEPKSVVWVNKKEPQYEFAPASVIVNSDMSLTATIDNNLPSGTVIRVFVQNGGDEFLNPSMEFARLVGNYSLSVDGLVEIPSLLDNPSLEVSLGDKLNLFFQPFVDTFPVDTALPLPVEYVAPSVSYSVTDAVYSLFEFGGGVISSPCYEEEVVVEGNTGDVAYFYVYFNDWADALKEPNQSLVIAFIAGKGVVNLNDYVPFDSYDFANKRLVYKLDNVVDKDWSDIFIPAQVVPELP